MYNSKLIQLYKAFSNKERKAFSLFLASPFFNKKQEVIVLHNYLVNTAKKDFPAEELTNEKVYSRIFSDKKYDDKALKYVTSDLLYLGLRFIGLQEYQKDSVHENYHILTSCANRGLHKHYEYLYKKTKSTLENTVPENAEKYYQLHILHDLANTKFLQQNIRGADPNLQKAADNLDLFYLTQKLRYLCEMTDRKKIFPDSEYQLHFADEILKHINKRQFENPAIRIYCQLFLTFSHPADRTYFKTLKDLLKENSALFAQKEMRDLYSFAINYCIQSIRAGKYDFTEELLELYVDGIENKILFENNYLNPYTFKNVIALGLRLQRYDWTENFINTYIDSLHKNNRDDAYNYNMAEFYYHKKDLNKATDYLIKVEFSDIFYLLDAKVMLMKVYYESDEEEALESLINSFTIYVKRSKRLSDEIKSMYRNFARILGFILRWKKEDHSDIEKIVHRTQYLAGREWLLEKVENEKC